MCKGNEAKDETPFKNNYIEVWTKVLHAQPLGYRSTSLSLSLSLSLNISPPRPLLSVFGCVADCLSMSLSAFYPSVRKLSIFYVRVCAFLCMSRTACLSPLTWLFQCIILCKSSCVFFYVYTGVSYLSKATHRGTCWNRYISQDRWHQLSNKQRNQQNVIKYLK